MAASKHEFVYKGYGCPNTEMWTLRAQFEEARPDLNHFMKKDAPHYASHITRMAYTEWENAYFRLKARPQVEVESFGDLPEVSGELVDVEK